MVLKSGSLNLLEPSGPVQAWNGIALPSTMNLVSKRTLKHLLWERGLDSCGLIQGDQKVSVHLMITVQKTRKNILNNFNHLP
jgi:hypothetical protein